MNFCETRTCGREIALAHGLQNALAKVEPDCRRIGSAGLTCSSAPAGIRATGKEGRVVREPLRVDNSPPIRRFRLTLWRRLHANILAETLQDGNTTPRVILRGSQESFLDGLRKPIDDREIGADCARRLRPAKFPILQGASTESVPAGELRLR